MGIRIRPDPTSRRKAVFTYVSPSDVRSWQLIDKEVTVNVANFEVGLANEQSRPIRRSIVFGISFIEKSGGLLGKNRVHAGERVSLVGLPV